MMKPKNKCAGIMVSDFIHTWFLALNDEEYERANSDIRSMHMNPLNMVNPRKATRQEINLLSEEGY